MEGLTILELLQSLWKKRKIIIFVTGFLTVLTLLHAMLFLSPTYTSTTSVYIVNRSENSNGLSNEELIAGSALTRDYREMILSDDVINTVIANLGMEIKPDSLKKKILIEIPEATRILSISVSDENSETAALLANELRIIGVKKISDVTRISDITTIQEAKPAAEPSSPHLVKTVATVAAAGFMGSVVFLLSLEFLDIRVKRREDIEGLGIPVLGNIPMIKMPRR